MCIFTRSDEPATAAGAIDQSAAGSRPKSDAK